MLRFVLTSCLLYAAAAIGLAQQGADIAHRYMQFALEKTPKAEGFEPPIAARAYGYLGLCLYESVQASLENSQSFSGSVQSNLRIPVAELGADYDYELVANAALSELIPKLFFHLRQSDLDSLASIERYFISLKKDTLPEAVVARSLRRGKAIALAVFEYSKTDGGHLGQDENYGRFEPKNSGTGQWQPQHGQKPLLPNWGKNRCFFLENKALTDISASKIPFSENPETAFFKEAAAVLKASESIGFKERKTIHFWADGRGTYSPAGHSMALLQQVLKAENADLQEVAIAYALVGMALSDAFVQSMGNKYAHNLIRPVDYIRQHIDSTFQTVIPTPAHPEFPSGHCTQAGAFAALMTVFFGERYSYVDWTYSDDFGNRYYPSFEAAAKEVGRSRLLAGLHYPFSNEAGLVLGKWTAEAALSVFQRQNPNVPLVFLEKKQLPFATFEQTSETIFVRNSEQLSRIELASFDGRVLKTISESFAAVDTKGLNWSRIAVRFYGKNGELLTQQMLSKTMALPFHAKRRKKPDIQPVAPPVKD